MVQMIFRHWIPAERYFHGEAFTSARGRSEAKGSAPPISVRFIRENGGVEISNGADGGLFFQLRREQASPDSARRVNSSSDVS